MEIINKTISLLTSEDSIKWYIIGFVSVIFALFLYPDLVITKYSYKLGDVAKRDIKASRDFFVEDSELTRINHKKAKDKVLTVYNFNIALTTKITYRIKQAFDESRAFFNSDNKITKNNLLKNSSTGKKITTDNQIRNIKKRFESKIGIPVSMGAYKILIKEKFSNDISDTISRILLTILGNGVVKNKEILLEETGKMISLKYSGTSTERNISNLRKFYGLDQAKTMVRIIGQPLLRDTNYILLNLVVDFCERLLQPNIILNEPETLKRKRIAVNEVKPVLYKIKAGEMLMREGERVTPVHLQKIKAMEQSISHEKLIINSTGAAMIVAAVLIIAYMLLLKHNEDTQLRDNRNLIFIASIFILFIFAVTVSSYVSNALSYNSALSLSGFSLLYGIPLASGAMIICMFLGINIAIAFALSISICATIILNDRFDIFIYFLFSSIMGAYWVRKTRKRNVLIYAGLKIGILNILILIMLNIYLTGNFHFKSVWNCVFAFMGGILAGIITSGILPLLESIFNYTTDIRLLELTNLEHPILKRLMMEAPGTYHHCMVVGSMAEAAAFEIGVNPILAKACGYYHDIGKINKPQYFIENQLTGKNRHDKLAPSMSSLILISHIKDGVEIAKKNKLGSKITDVIRQHHGTSLISYFYEKAKKIKGDDSVEINNFRYPGPKPQTREAGLLMLADVVEASSRTLGNPTPARIQGQVQKIVNNIFSDGQLDECELTLKDLNNIAKSFNRILNGIYHHRIEYPEKTTGNEKENTVGSIDKQQSKSVQGELERNKEESTGSLKRLGMS